MKRNCQDKENCPLATENRQQDVFSVDEEGVLDETLIDSSHLDSVLADLEGVRPLREEYAGVLDEEIIPEDLELEIEEKKQVSGGAAGKGKRYVSDSPMKAYLKEINQIPLLTADEEKELAMELEKKRIALKQIEIRLGMSSKRFRKWNEQYSAASQGAEVQRQDNTLPLSRQEGIQCALPSSTAGFSAGEIKYILHQIDSIETAIEDIKRKFVEANLRLVVTVAKRYVPGGIIGLLDIINEGNLGLVKAVERYSYMEGYRFSTYAIWWIKQAIMKAISDQSRTIRVPIYMVEIINRCMRCVQSLSQELGREPELGEIAEKMNLPVPKVIELINIAQEPVSLDSPMGIDGESQLGDLIEDREVLSPAKASFLRMLQERINIILNTFPEKERMTLKLRFGLDGMEPHTLEEVGKILGLTRERVRQIEKSVLERLRNMKKTRELEDFLKE